jgi:TfoX/Sxy family transcriptional regulator of competence genes
MAFDDVLADRVRDVLATTVGVTERKMFGGLAFSIAGNMACGIVGPDLMLRLGEGGADEALDEPHVRPMDFTGRPMRSMVYVAASGITTRDALETWVLRAVEFAARLPPK